MRKIKTAIKSHKNQTGGSCFLSQKMIFTIIYQYYHLLSHTSCCHPVLACPPYWRDTGSRFFSERTVFVWIPDQVGDDRETLHFLCHFVFQVFSKHQSGMGVQTGD